MKITRSASVNIMEDQSESEDKYVDIFTDNITSIEKLAVHHIRHHGKHHQHYKESMNDNMDITLNGTICYTTNQVLLIIGLTCVLNLAFIVLIMGCVHFCSSSLSNKIADFTRVESVLVMDTDSESDELLSRRPEAPPGKEEEYSKEDKAKTSKYWDKLNRKKNKSQPPSLSMENLLFV